MKLERLLVNRRQLKELGVTLSSTQIDRLERCGRFPRRIKLGTHRNSRVVYPYGKVIAWIDKQALNTPPLKDDEVS